MWRALTSDLNEFVSTVAGDTAEVLNRMDENFPDGTEEGELMTPAAEERLRRMESHETFDLPLISEDDDEEYKKDVKEFLASFKIDEKTEEISTLLKENPDTLKLAFEALVPTKVSYEVFWQCYFYRCDEDRINKEIEEEEKEAARQAEATRVDAFKSISVVGSLFDGAVKAVSNSLKDDSSKKGAAAAGTGLPFHSRPPFVLNTAVDEDEDEEVGWDDEEEEEGEDNGDNGEGQIEFKDAVAENLQEQLKLALVERQQLHQTVEMQKKEIALLKSPEHENQEIQTLKAKLLELESKVTARQGGDEAPAAAQIERLNKELEQERSSRLKVTNEKVKLEVEVSELRLKVDTFHADISKLTMENKRLQSNLDEAETLLKSLEKEAAKVEGTTLLGKNVKPETVSVVDPDEAAGEASVASPDTVTSAIKVEAPLTAAPGGEPDGGWDDDW